MFHKNQLKIDGGKNKLIEPHFSHRNRSQYLNPETKMERLVDELERDFTLF